MSEGIARPLLRDASLLTIPPELLNLIIANLDLRALIACLQVSKVFVEKALIVECVVTDD